MAWKEVLKLLGIVWGVWKEINRRTFGSKVNNQESLDVSVYSFYLSGVF